jgi:hypothetical protein
VQGLGIIDKPRAILNKNDAKPYGVYLYPYSIPLIDAHGRTGFKRLRAP